jgi:hypothetical protein
MSLNVQSGAPQVAYQFWPECCVPERKEALRAYAMIQAGDNDEPVDRTRVEAIWSSEHRRYG